MSARERVLFGRCPPPSSLPTTHTTTTRPLSSSSSTSLLDVTVNNHTTTLTNSPTMSTAATKKAPAKKASGTKSSSGPSYSEYHLPFSRRDVVANAMAPKPRRRGEIRRASTPLRWSPLASLPLRRALTPERARSNLEVRRVENRDGPRRARIDGTPRTRKQSSLLLFHPRCAHLGHSSGVFLDRHRYLGVTTLELAINTPLREGGEDRARRARPSTHPHPREGHRPISKTFTHHRHDQHYHNYDHHD